MSVTCSRISQPEVDTQSEGFLKKEPLLRGHRSFLLIRVPYNIGDLKRDPDLENYPYSSSSLMQND